MPDLVALTYQQVTPPAFVEFWRRAYSADPASYNDNIQSAGILTTANVVALMVWKAGRRFAADAERYALGVPIKLLNDARHGVAPPSDQDLRQLYDDVTSALRNENLQATESIIWRIFLCHIGQPVGTPIYDVNTWRAWGLLDGWLEPEHLSQRPIKFETYLKFRTWSNLQIATHGLDPQHLDRALVALGEFLGTRWYQLL